MTEETFAAMEESSWTGTKETARWNGAYSEPLSELDLNRTNEDTNGIVVAGISGSIAQEEAQDDPFDQFVEVAKSTPADDKMAESIDEARSGPESPDLDDENISAENLAAIRDAQQPTPKRPKRNSARSGTTYVPTCSPNGTEISNREKAKQSTLETGLPSSSNSSKSKKRKANTPTSSLADSEGKRKKRTAAVKKMNDSSQSFMIDLTETEEQNKGTTVPDDEEEEETVLPAKQKEAVKGRKKKLVADDEGEEEISHTNNPKPSGSDQEVASQNESKEHQEDESCSKRECDDEMGKEAILKTSKKREAESKESKPTSSNGSSGVVSERSSRTTFEDTTVVEKNESQTLVPRSGKSISSILGPSRFNGARHIGLAKRHSVPSLHLNRREKPIERKSVLIKLETKKKKGQTNDCSDDEDANPFKRREGESEQEFLLRVCDEEGTYDKEKSKSQNGQENEGNEREAEELFPDDNEQEYNYRGEED